MNLEFTPHPVSRMNRGGSGAPCFRVPQVQVKDSVPVVGMLPLDYVTCLCSGEQRAMEVEPGGGGEGEVEPGEVEAGGGGGQGEGEGEGHCSSP